MLAVRAALSLFAERGYENTTVVNIVERAGLGKTTFFRYFRDKREVPSARPDAAALRSRDGGPRSPLP